MPEGWRLAWPWRRFREGNLYAVPEPDGHYLLWCLKRCDAAGFSLQQMSGAIDHLPTTSEVSRLLDGPPPHLAWQLLERREFVALKPVALGTCRRAIR